MESGKKRPREKISLGASTSASSFSQKRPDFPGDLRVLVVQAVGARIEQELPEAQGAAVAPCLRTGLENQEVQSELSGVVAGSQTGRPSAEDLNVRAGCFQGTGRIRLSTRTV